ncbi:trypco2 family protein [Humibacillus xanthopallidus]|uniref:trypco2 family protein n=1 Tax=Humibacillus xanthopallidus TaxID=412689 RepID=UPI001C8A98FE
MTDISLGEFLSDLRAELVASENSDESGLKLGVDEVTIQLEVRHVRETEATAKVAGKAKFWVLAEGGAEASGKVAGSKEATQQLTLKLRPRIDTRTPAGTSSTGFDVSSRARDEETREPGATT